MSLGGVPNKEVDREIKEKRQERLSEIKDEEEKEAKLRELSKKFDVTNSSEKSENSNEYQEKFSNFVKRVDDFCDGLVNKSSPIIKEMKREIIEFFDPSLQNGDTNKINSFYRELKKDLLKNAGSVTENAKKEFREYLESLSTESKIPDFLRQVNNFSENIEDEINKRLVRNLNNILMDINANLGTLYENKDLTKDQKSKKVIGYIDSYIV
ncbi:MAG: hypothetical protein U0469_00245 [Candidatus Paceibacterota bacterium]|jgi:nitrate/nitrite-specific signal transduction histidine kinase